MNSGKTLVIFVFTCLGAIAHGQNVVPPVEFKGALLGGDSKTLSNTGFEWTCDEIPGGSQKLCTPKYQTECSRIASTKPIEGSQCRKDNGGTFAGIPIERLSAFITKDRLTSVLFSMHTSFYDQIVVALKTKYGEPTSSAAKNWQNRSGAVFPSHATSWSTSTGVITISKHGTNLDEMQAGFTAAKTEAQILREKEIAAKAAKDI